MASLTKYFKLMKEHPQLFVNPNEDGVIKIITNPEKIKVLQAEKKKEYKENGKKPEWIDIGVLSEDPWFWVLRDLVEFPDGKVGGYLRVLNRKSLDGGTNVVIMAMQNEKVFILKHFRHDTRSWYWEFPRGFGEPGLSGEENAKEELLEEIGLPPKKLTEIGSMKDGEGETIFYLAEIQEGKSHRPSGEAIQNIELIELSELENWVFSGQITDWFTLIAYMQYKKGSMYSRLP